MGESILQEIVCCLGQPVAGNPTQFMMERAFAAAGLDWRYLTLEIAPQQLEDAIRGLRAMGFAGGNLTGPHRTAVVELLDELTESARWIGAVNCIYRADHRLVGDNTDGPSFLESLGTLADPADKHLVLLGAGSVARAIAWQLVPAAPASLTIVNRSQRGEQLAEQLRAAGMPDVRWLPWESNLAVPQETDILVQATSLGSGPSDERPGLDYDTLQPRQLVADVVVHPPDTPLIRAARARGCETLDGLGMFVAQAALSFRTWTGRDADAVVMREAMEEFLEL